MQDGPFDRKLRRDRRDRSARRGEAADYLFRRAAEDLLERLDLVKRPFRQALALGCPYPPLVDELRARGFDVVAADPGRLFAEASGGVQCDEDRLPFGPASFDLVVALGTLDTVNDLPGALVQIRQALRPDGLLLAAFSGAGSLPRLREALRAADEAEGHGASPHIHPQIDARSAGDLLARAGFALPVVDRDEVIVRFPGLAPLIDDLRAMAATNILLARPRRPFGKIGFAAATAAFAAGADPDGRVAERFEILHLSGWAPSPDQPRPARRGSASVSMADALKRRD